MDRLIGRAAGVLWTSKVVLLQIPAGHGNLLLRVARAKVGFLARVWLVQIWQLWGRFKTWDEEESACSAL